VRIGVQTGSFERQAGLADTARTHQRHQTAGPDGLGHTPKLASPTDEAGESLRQVPRRRFMSGAEPAQAYPDRPPSVRAGHRIDPR